MDLAPPASDTLEVPGARLYYEVRGSGPGLMLVGHPMGASGFAAIAALLAEDHTVVTYDPRGFGRSTIADPDQDAAPEVLADDVRRVLEVVGSLPAQMFGSSGGAVTGLALVAGHPGHVSALVAHEPPLALLVADAEKARSGLQEIYDTYRERGVAAAGERFSDFVVDMHMRPESAAPGEESPPADAVAAAERAFGHGLLPIVLYQPDLRALRAASTRIVVAGGITSRGEFPQCAAAALARRLGIPLLDFPGGHTGFLSEPDEYAALLRATLRDDRELDGGERHQQ